MKFFLAFTFLLTLAGCGDSKTATSGTENLGVQKLSKRCTTGGTIAVYQKTSSHSGGGTVTLKGFSLRSSSAIQGCPSSVSFTCTSSALTEAAFGNNLTGNERYVCTGGKATFPLISNTQTPYRNTPLTTSYTTPYSGSTPRSYQSSADILQSDIWLVGQGPLKKSSINGTIEFLITAGRYVPLPCAVQFSCP